MTHRIQHRIAGLTLLLLAAWQPANAAPRGVTYTPKAGSAERQAIMDALRKPVGRQVGHKVIFVVETLRVRDGWAFLVGSARNPNGSPLGAKDLWGSTTALLRGSGRNWRVLMWNFATDTGVMERIKKKYPQAPRSIFPM